MAEFRTTYNLLQASEKVDIRALLTEALSELTEPFVNLQTEQMYAGIGSDGELIERLNVNYYPYAAFTVQEKENKGQPTDRVTLRDEGNFYRGIYAEPMSDGFDVDSRDEKSEKLKAAYGFTIFGLSDDYKLKFKLMIASVWFAKITNQINEGTGVAVIEESILV